MLRFFLGYFSTNLMIVHMRVVLYMKILPISSMHFAQWMYIIALKYIPSKSFCLDNFIEIDHSISRFCLFLFRNAPLRELPFKFNCPNRTYLDVETRRAICACKFGRHIKICFAFPVQFSNGLNYTSGGTFCVCL